MVLSVGDALLKLGIDTTDLNKGLEGLDTQITSSMKKMQDGLKVGGAAMTAFGAAGLKMVSTARDLNAQLGQTGITIGASTEEMRDLALATTNVTFPLDSVTKTFDLLARAGITNTDTMQASVKAFDSLADATGSSAEEMADLLLPAFKLFGEEIPTTSAELDKFTWLTKNTTVDMADFGTLLTRMAPYMDDLNLSMDDAVAILAALSDKGIQGTAATLALRTAITKAATEGTSLTDVLGITQESIDGYKNKMNDAVGVTDKYAAVANTQYGIMDILKQKFQEISLVAGSFLAPLEPMLAAMTALGPVMLFFSSSMGTAAIKTIAHTAAIIGHTAAMIWNAATMWASVIATQAVTAAQWLWNAAMSANPIGLVILAIAALVAGIILLVKNWDWVKAKAIELWGFIKDFFIDIGGKIKTVFENLTPVGIIIGHWDEISTAAHRIWDAIMDFLGNLNPWKGMETNWKQLTENATGVFTNINDGVKKWWDDWGHWLSLLVPWSFLLTHWEEITTSATAVFTTISDNVKAWWDTFTTYLKSLLPWNSLKEAWEGVFDGVKGVLDRIFGSGLVTEWTGALDSYWRTVSFEDSANLAFGTIATAASEVLLKINNLTAKEIASMKAMWGEAEFTYPAPYPAPDGQSSECRGKDLWYYTPEMGWYCIQKNSPQCTGEEPEPTPPEPPEPPGPIPPEVEFECPADTQWEDTSGGTKMCYKCVGVDLWGFERTSKAWRLWNSNDTRCGGTGVQPAAPPPTIPTPGGGEFPTTPWYEAPGGTREIQPYEGATRYKCVGYGLWTFDKGAWRLTERNSTRCGFVPEAWAGVPEEEIRPPETSFERDGKFFKTMRTQVQIPGKGPADTGTRTTIDVWAGNRWDNVHWHNLFDLESWTESAFTQYLDYFMTLAKGGIVTRPTLAMLAEKGIPEMVIPLPKLGALGALGNIINNFNIAELVVREELDIDKVSRRLLKLQQSTMRRAGIA